MQDQVTKDIDAKPTVKDQGDVPSSSELLGLLLGAVDLISYLAEDETTCSFDHSGACQEHHGGFRLIVRQGTTDDWVHECWYIAARRFIHSAQQSIHAASSSA